MHQDVRRHFEQGETVLEDRNRQLRTMDVSDLGGI